ncbi:hypothetical protein C8R43DRAFT_1140580 [Mycena crocata]|nr:hypothetical protein C8R43DRAFT_1140580 [Mycena crocata]
MSSSQPTKKPQILRSGTYWQNFHRNRAAWLERRAQRSTRGLHHGFNQNALGPLHDQPPIMTFIPNRRTPVISTVQNDGSLLTTYHPGPNERMDVPRPAPTPASSSRRASEIARRAEHAIRNKPSEDEVLLARLSQSLAKTRTKGGKAPSPENESAPVRPQCKRPAAKK